MFSNARRVLSQCKTRLRLLYLLNIIGHDYFSYEPLCKYGTRTRYVGGGGMHFYFCSITNKIHSLVFYILGAFSSKTVIRLALVDYLLSHIKQALGE